jgi:hypothetical protein
MIDLLVGRVNRIGSVANVAADFNAQITPDGSWVTVGRHGGTEHLTSSHDGILSFPNHGTNWAGSHVFDQAREKLLFLQIDIVFLHVLLARLGQLHGHKLESLGFKSLDNFTNESALDTIGLCRNDRWNE